MRLSKNPNQYGHKLSQNQAQQLPTFVRIWVLVKKIHNMYNIIQNTSFSYETCLGWMNNCRQHCRKEYTNGFGQDSINQIEYFNRAPFLDV